MANKELKTLAINGEKYDIRDDSKQDTLVSGSNIRTINGVSVLGSGNISISQAVDASLSSTSTNPVQNKAVSSALAKKADLTNAKQTVRMGVAHTDSVYFGDEATVMEAKGGELYFNGDKVAIGSMVSNEVTLVQGSGQSETAVMSQKAVTEAIKASVGEVLYEQYYYPNMGATTDTERFSDSTEILQPTAFVGDYTDADGTKWTNVFECESFPDWFDFAQAACSPYGNGFSVGYGIINNFNVNDDGELLYDLATFTNKYPLSKAVPYFNQVANGIKKIDETHFKIFANKNGSYEFTSFYKDTVNCASFFFQNPCHKFTFDITGCKKIRVTVTGNTEFPNKYPNNFLLWGNASALLGYTHRQVLFGRICAEYELDTANNRYRQTHTDFSIIYRDGHDKFEFSVPPMSFSADNIGIWLNIAYVASNGAFIGWLDGSKKQLFLTTNTYYNPFERIFLGSKIKIEKLA